MFGNVNQKAPFFVLLILESKFMRKTFDNLSGSTVAQVRLVLLATLLFAAMFVLPAFAQTAAPARLPRRLARRSTFQPSTSSVPRTCSASSSGAMPT